MLINALNSDFGELDLRIEGVGKINFYQLFPLYQEELEYKKSMEPMNYWKNSVMMILCRL